MVVLWWCSVRGQVPFDCVILRAMMRPRRWKKQMQKDWVGCKGAVKRDCEALRVRAGARVGAKCNGGGMLVN